MSSSILKNAIYMPVCCSRFKYEFHIPLQVGAKLKLGSNTARVLRTLANSSGTSSEETPNHSLNRTLHSLPPFGL